MEAFSLLRYWRGGGGAGGSLVVGDGGGGGCEAAGGGGGGGGVPTNSAAAITTIVTAVNAAETDEDDGGGNDDDGPFFDLEFAVPEEDNGGGDVEEEEDDENDVSSDAEREFNFTLSSSASSDGRADQSLTLSPSDDLFFKGKLVPIETTSSVFNGSEPNSEPNSKANNNHQLIPVSLLKSATKFRVFLLGFKKSKALNDKSADKNDTATSAPDKDQEILNADNVSKQPNKLFTVKFKVEEVPIVSLFTRDSSKTANNKTQKHTAAVDGGGGQESAAAAGSSDEKRFSKEVMHKYLKKVKPAYIRVSKRYVERLKLSGQLSFGAKSAAAAADAPEKCGSEAEGGCSPANNLVVQQRSVKQGNLPAGLRVVCKRLGKSKSASSAVVAAAPPSGTVGSRRRDDSLLQQQDGIQGAILHCKRSFNASRDSESSLLSRSVSDPSHEKSSELSRKSSAEEKVEKKAGNLVSD